MPGSRGSTDVASSELQRRADDCRCESGLCLPEREASCSALSPSLGSFWSFENVYRLVRRTPATSRVVVRSPLEREKGLGLGGDSGRYGEGASPMTLEGCNRSGIQVLARNFADPDLRVFRLSALSATSGVFRCEAHESITLVSCSSTKPATPRSGAIKTAFSLQRAGGCRQCLPLYLPSEVPGVLTVGNTTHTRQPVWASCEFGCRISRLSGGGLVS